MTPDSQASATDWVQLLAEALGTTPPTDEEIDHLLAIAGTAAHASQRTAAPLSTWLVGRAGVPPSEAREAVSRLAHRLAATA